MPSCLPLVSITAEESCFESFGGLGTTAWLFLHSDLKSDLKFYAANEIPETSPYEQVGTDTSDSVVYNGTDPLKSGAEFGFVKIELKPNSQSITGENNATNKGFKQTAQLIFDQTNERISRLCRSLNNRHGKWGVIIKDGYKYQIMYTAGEALTLDAGSIKTETGAGSSDDRQTTLAPVLDKAWAPETYIYFGTKDGGAGDKTPDDFNV